MYIPRHNRQDDLDALHGLMRRYNFAVLFSQANGVPWATHLPFLLDPAPEPYGTLRAHLARANPHWRTWALDQEVLVVFQGPHAYISPAWYTEAVAVPTWNYVAVHAYGTPRLIHDPAALQPMVLDLVACHEAEGSGAREKSAPVAANPNQLKAIVGVEIPISRLEGKWKLSQNRSPADQEGVAAVLEASPDSVEREVARLMRVHLEAH